MEVKFIITKLQTSDLTLAKTVQKVTIEVFPEEYDSCEQAEMVVSHLAKGYYQIEKVYKRR